MSVASGPRDWPARSPTTTGHGDRAAPCNLWTQVVGKIRMRLTPAVNHWWHVPLYVGARGLTTSPMPHGGRTLEIAFDFIDHRLDIVCSDGAFEYLPLAPMSVAVFHREVMAALERLGVTVRIWTTPCEIENPIPFELDEVHASYDADAAQRFWRLLVQADRVLKLFRARFIGKASPTHFFWGSFDLAVTRFSGRRAPPHPGFSRPPCGGEPGGLFARGLQLRLLAGGAGRAGDVLCLRLSGARRLRPGDGAPADRAVGRGPGRIRAALRSHADRQLTRSRAARIPAIDLRSGRQSRALAARRARAQAARSRRMSEPAPVKTPATAVAWAAAALGALAVGALAIGALSIGRLAIGRLAIGRVRLRRLEIGDLTVGRLHVLDEKPKR